MKLSAIVITKNEEAVIRRCLQSVAWADEIVVVDSGSTDRTLDICRELGVKIQVTPDWPGPGPQRNRAIDLARGEWVLALDADEWVTEELRREIEQTLRSPERQGGIPCAASFQLLRPLHAAQRLVARLRLAPVPARQGPLRRRHRARSPAPARPVGKLRAHLMHEAFTDLEEVLQKVNSYSTWGAQTLDESGKRAGLLTAIAHGLWTFLKTYVLHAGFLDGREGFMLAVSNAEGTYYKYAKLWLRGRHKDAGR